MMTNSMKRICITFVATCLIQVFPGSSFADMEYTKEYNARRIQVIDGSARMRYSEVGFFGTKVGDVGSKEIPEVINLGDHITIKGKTVQANIIKVTEHLRDMRWLGELLAKKGQVRCMVAATAEDFPDYGDVRDRIWIDVDYCLALK